MSFDCSCSFAMGLGLAFMDECAAPAALWLPSTPRCRSLCCSLDVEKSQVLPTQTQDTQQREHAAADSDVKVIAMSDNFHGPCSSRFLRLLLGHSSRESTLLAVRAGMRQRTRHRVQACASTAAVTSSDQMSGSDDTRTTLKNAAMTHVNPTHMMGPPRSRSGVWHFERVPEVSASLHFS